MKVLVTGGCGFIGSHIVEYHLNKGDEVYVVDNLSTGKGQNIDLFKSNPNYQFEHADIITWPNIEKVVGWADRIYHMAAVVGNLRVIVEPVNVIASNIAGTERIFRFITKSGHLPRVIVASSSCVYGSQAKAMGEEDDLITEAPGHMRSNYAISKLCDEIIGLSYNSINKIPTTVIRFFNTIGPRQTGSYGFVLPRFVEQACRNEPMTIYGDGTQTRSFCDVRDVVVALDLLANNDKSVAEVVNVGHDQEISIKALSELIRTHANSNSEIRYMDYKEIYKDGFQDVMYRKPELEKFFQLTNFKYKWTLKTTIDDLIQEFRKKQN